MFVIIEMADVELVGLHVYTEEQPARSAFETIVNRNQCAPEFSPEDLAREIAGTIAAGGRRHIQRASSTRSAGMTSVAREWLRYGFNAHERDAWQRNLVHDPAEAKAWADGGIGPDLAEAFKKSVRYALPEDVVPHLVHVPNRWDQRLEVDIPATLVRVKAAVQQRIAIELALVQGLADPQRCYCCERPADLNAVVDGRVRTLCTPCGTSRADVHFPWASADTGDSR